MDPSCLSAKSSKYRHNKRLIVSLQPEDAADHSHHSGLAENKGGKSSILVQVSASGQVTQQHTAEDSTDDEKAEADAKKAEADAKKAEADEKKVEADKKEVKVEERATEVTKEETKLREDQAELEKQKRDLDTEKKKAEAKKESLDAEKDAVHADQDEVERKNEELERRDNEGGCEKRTKELCNDPCEWKTSGVEYAVNLALMTLPGMGKCLVKEVKGVNADNSANN